MVHFYQLTPLLKVCFKGNDDLALPQIVHQWIKHSTHEFAEEISQSNHNTMPKDPPDLAVLTRVTFGSVLISFIH